MEVYVKGAPLRVSENQFQNFIRPYLTDLDIHDWQCDKKKQKAFAFLRFLNDRDGERFLARHGHSSGSPILYFGAPLICQRSSKSLNPLALKSLQMESKARLKAPKPAIEKRDGRW